MKSFGIFFSIFPLELQQKSSPEDGKDKGNSAYDSNEENGNASSVVNKNGLEQPENGFR